MFNAEGDPSTISLREIAYGTAQDDSVITLREIAYGTAQDDMIRLLASSI